MLPMRTLWKANIIAFISSFCVMVIELVASRILAPHIGVSLYTWTSIIGVILAGIATGNYFGGKLADRYPSPLVLVTILFIGALLTIAILPATKMVTAVDLFSNLPVMLDFAFKTAFIFFLPAVVLSIVSPLVIKLTLADLGQTGGIVGTIYAFSTAGSILGTFMTGFYLILWLGTRMIVWLVAGILIMTGIIILFAWRKPFNEGHSRKNHVMRAIAIIIPIAYLLLFQFRGSWQENYTKESSYFTIRVEDFGANVNNYIKVLYLDSFPQSYVIPNHPTVLIYDYLEVLEEIIRYSTKGNPAPRILHLGGGGYCLPRYMEALYPQSSNEVVEIDPAVTQVAHAQLGLRLDTRIKTYNQDARLFLIQQKTGKKYDVIVADVFNDFSTPYHLTTLEFNRMIKANLIQGGVYLININDYEYSRYTPSFIHTLQQVFAYVYLFNSGENWEKGSDGDPVITSTDRIIAATEHFIDLPDYMDFVTEGGKKEPVGYPLDASELSQYLAHRNPILLTDDHAPTDILLAPIFR